MKYIFFDLDGPILDVSKRHYAVYSSVVRELGGVPLDLGAFWRAKREKLPEVKIAERSGLIIESFQEFQRLKIARIESDIFLSLDTVQSDVSALLHQLAVTHNLVLVTLRNSRILLNEQLNKLSLRSCFTSVLSGRDDHKAGWRVKTDLVRQKFTKLSKSDYFIGDTETDILAGKELGLRTVAVTNGIRTEEYLRSFSPDQVLESGAQFRLQNDEM